MKGIALRKPAVKVPAPPPSFVVCVPGALTEAECLGLRDLVDLDRPESAITKAGYEPLVRRSTIAWVPESEDWGWADKRMVSLLADANRDWFGFDLQGFEERFQVARYEAVRRGTFDWHADRAHSGLASTRKLSITLQLSEKLEYRGGNLEFFADGRKWRAPSERGTAIVFASFLSHRVTPVTQGVRHSLVAWAHGPAFK